MRRFKRLNVTGGLYHVVVRSRPSMEFLRLSEDRARFEAHLYRALDDCNARLHAYSWLPSAAHMAIQVAAAPLDQLMMRLCGSFAREFNRRHIHSGPVFRSPYGAVLVEPGPYMLDLVRHIHLQPKYAALCDSIDDYRWSSHSAYLGRMRSSFLFTRKVTDLLSQRGADPRQVYCELMREPESARVAAQLEEWSRSSGGFLGGPLFTAALLEDPVPPEPDECLRRIIAAVAEKCHVKVDELYSDSRRRPLSLARALVSWHAVRTGITSLSMVAAHFNRRPLTLHVAMKRYREKRHDLFRGSLEDLLNRSGNRESPR